MGPPSLFRHQTAAVTHMAREHMPLFGSSGVGLMSTLVFDCDGVLADTERYGHLPAFNATFAEFGLPVRWDEDEYARRLAIGGGKERMASLFSDPGFTEVAGIPDDEQERAGLLLTWDRAKTAHSKRMVADGELPPRSPHHGRRPPGVHPHRPRVARGAGA